MKINAKPGDYVEIRTSDATHSGILMPRPELADKDHVIIKLDSGYNMGIELKKIKGVKKLQKKERLERFPAGKVVKNPKLNSIAILGCGGTIASRVDYETGGVKGAMTPEEIFFTVPELKNIANLDRVDLLFNIPSENITPKHWKKMAEEAAKSLNSGAHGVVFMHGTDVMHYSSAAMAFMLKNLNGPVVLTGAQRSSDRGSSDAAQNLICSSYVAANSDLGEPVICMHGSVSDDFCYVHRGTKVRKMHTSRRDTFRSINAKPLMQVFPNGEIKKLSKYKRAQKGEVVADTKFEEKVAIVKTYPNANPEMIDFLVDRKYKGIVVEATGLGHAPLGDMSWERPLKRAIDSRVAVVFTPQTLYGRLNPFVYDVARNLKSLGVIYAEDMLPETAYVKLGWVLGHGLDPAEEMVKDYVGEISERSEELEVGL
jgi:glutamyl-tRNA(Gln) amidotransferase subunit D